MSKRGQGGDASTLRDYWSGHGHAGPSHGAERDAIAWGTPGDFNRCVAQVTAHGHMTPEQAKGYCNLRHHDALGYYPSQHAAMDRGKAQFTVSEAVYDMVRKALGPTNVRGTDNRFREYEGDNVEAARHIRDGHPELALPILHRARGGTKQPAQAIIKAIESGLAKVGPHGYSHGWVKLAADLKEAHAKTGSEPFNNAAFHAKKASDQPKRAGGFDDHARYASRELDPIADHPELGTQAKAFQKRAQDLAAQMPPNDGTP